MTTTVRRLLGALLAVLAPVVVVVGYLALRSGVPDPLPVHWNLRGAVDNTGSARTFFVTTLAISAVLAVAVAAAIWLAHSPMAGRMLASLLTFGAWLPAVICLTTLIASSGAARAQDVALPWYTVVVTVLVPGLIAVGAWELLPGRWEPAPPAARASSITLEPGERVVWIGHEHSAVMRVLSALLAVAGVVMLEVRTQVAIPLFVVAVALALTSELAVRIDPAGVHTLWGPFGWPRPHIPLADIASAHAEQIDPMAWGGWGYRISGRGVAAVIRRGPGLVVERTDKPTYAVTVPDADRGADVLNALLARRQAPAAEPPAPGDAPER